VVRGLGQVGGRIRVEAGALEIQEVLPPWLRLLRTHHPEISIELQEIDSPDHSRLFKDQVDVIVDHQPRLPLGSRPASSPSTAASWWHRRGTGRRAGRARPSPPSVISRSSLSRRRSAGGPAARGTASAAGNWLMGLGCGRAPILIHDDSLSCGPLRPLLLAGAMAEYARRLWSQLTGRSGDSVQL
jgi:hypothetical protein